MVQISLIRSLLSVLILCLFSGCTLNRAQMRRAEAVVNSIKDTDVICEQSDHCALPSPYHAIATEVMNMAGTKQAVHYVNLLDRGEESLILRVHLIRAARKSIDLQTFIFSKDDAGQLLLDELIQAARRGVRVRVLTDQLFTLNNTQLLAQLATAHINFEFKIYNPTFNKATTHPLDYAAGVLCCFFSFNQRMHNKLFLVDDVIGISGGRNYEDRYFDWDDEFDYRDRDVLVTGPAANQMRASFEQFWQHPRTYPLTALRDVVPSIFQQGEKQLPPILPVFKYPERVAALRIKANDQYFINIHFAQHALRVSGVDYFSDSPNKFLERRSPEERAVAKDILALIDSAKDEIVMQTPYLVISKKAGNTFQKLRQTNPNLRIVISTNSLAATDAFYVYAISYKYKKKYIKHYGFEIYEFKPFPADASEMITNYEELGKNREQPEKAYRKFEPAPLKRNGVRVGMHAKSIVIDGKVTLIGSHNFDPRSDHYNTESGFIIYDADFAAHVRASILHDTKSENSWVIAKRPRPPILAALNNVITDISTALPIFDIWPFRYATSYELNSDCRPLRPNDPNFYNCYTSVGDFPEVNLPVKTIYTRIVTAFGAGLVSIL